VDANFGYLWLERFERVGGEERLATGVGCWVILQFVLFNLFICGVFFKLVPCRFDDDCSCWICL